MIQRQHLLLLSLIVVLFGALVFHFYSKKNQNPQISTDIIVGTDPNACSDENARKMVRNLALSAKPKEEYQNLSNDGCVKAYTNAFEDEMYKSNLCGLNFLEADNPQELIQLLENSVEKENIPSGHEMLCGMNHGKFLDTLKKFQISWSDSVIKQENTLAEVEFFSSYEIDKKMIKVGGLSIVFKQWGDAKWRLAQKFKYPCRIYSTYDSWDKTVEKNQTEGGYLFPEFLSSQGITIVPITDICEKMGVSVREQVPPALLKKSEKLLVFKDGTYKEFSSVYSGIHSDGGLSSFPFLRSYLPLEDFKENPQWVFIGDNIKQKMKSIQWSFFTEGTNLKLCSGLSLQSAHHYIYQSTLLPLDFYYTEETCPPNSDLDENNTKSSFGLVSKDNKCIELSEGRVDCYFGSSSEPETVFKLGDAYWLFFHTHDGDTGTDNGYFVQYDPKLQKLVTPPKP
jgi:hypothetical protein